MIGKKAVFRAIIFLLLLSLSFCVIQPLFTVDNERAFDNLRGLYYEEEDSLDAVYIGSSNVHAFWQPPLAWANYGIAVWSFSVDALPARAIKYLITEARKTQPDALYIVNLNSFHKTEIDAPIIHRATDFMPLSANKLALMNRLMDDAGIKGFDRLEYYFPILRFHSRWSELASWCFNRPDTSLKCAIASYRYFKMVVDITEKYSTTQRRAPISEEKQSILEELLDYCEAEHLNVLFVSVPHSLGSEQLTEELNTMADLVQERGFPCLHLLTKASELGIQTDTDYYNAGHTNVHGSIKYTEYLSQYLVTNYGFSDKRGQPGWESWDAAVDAYTKLYGPWSLPFERINAPRDYSLVGPKLPKISVKDQQITLTWPASKNAQRYEIFRKSEAEKNGCWHSIAVVNAKTLLFVDEDLLPDTVYTYTVVPFRIEGDTRVYGSFRFAGVSATTAGGGDEE